MSLNFEKSYTTVDILPISEELCFAALPERGEAHSRSGTHSFHEHWRQKQPRQESSSPRLD